MSFTPHEWQVRAAMDYHTLGGVFVGLDPGVGKTYAAALIARGCRRPLVVAPASAIPQTRKQFQSYGLATYPASQWREERAGDAHEAVVFASYTWLTRKEQSDFIQRFAPTDILMDEFHLVRGLGNSARKRIERDLIARPEVRVGVFTGSPMGSGGVADLAFGLRWALRGHVRNLVPSDSGIEALQLRLDEDDAFRDAWRGQLQATPGVYLDVDAGRYEGEVVINVLRREPLLTLAPTWELPDGYLIESAAHAASIERMLAYGWWPSVDPRPSAAYVEARRTWGQVVRRCVFSGFADTEEQVRDIRPREYRTWRLAAEAEGELGVAVPEWSPDARRYVRGLVQDVPDRTLIWAHHRALQDMASSITSAPMFREGGRSSMGSYLPDYRGPVAVASVAACYQSLNLQHFSRNLVLEPPSDAEVWKQLIGRTARQGQTSERVTVDVVVNSPAAETALRTALARARSTMQTTGKGNPLLQLESKEW